MKYKHDKKIRLSQLQDSMLIRKFLMELFLIYLKKKI